MAWFSQALLPGCLVSAPQEHADNDRGGIKQRIIIKQLISCSSFKLGLNCGCQVVGKHFNTTTALELHVQESACSMLLEINIWTIFGPKMASSKI